MKRSVTHIKEPVSLAYYSPTLMDWIPYRRERLLIPKKCPEPFSPLDIFFTQSTEAKCTLTGNLTGKQSRPNPQDSEEEERKNHQHKQTSNTNSRSVVLLYLKENKQDTRQNLLGCHGFLLKCYKSHSQWVIMNSLFLFWIFFHQFISNFGIIIYSILLLGNYWLLHPSTRWLISSLK